MKLRLDILALAVAAAVALHIAAVLATRSLPLVGTGRLAEAAADLLHDPELAEVSPRDPLRVMLGVAVRGPVAAPGPRAVLDPLGVRKRPDLGAEWPDIEARLEAARGLFMPPPELASEAKEPLRASPPEGTPSWADREVADAAIPLEVKVTMRRLPARFLPPPPLAAAAKAARPDASSLQEGLDLPAPPALPETLPDWPEPARAIMLPEVFVDVLEIGP